MAAGAVKQVASSSSVAAAVPVRQSVPLGPWVLVYLARPPYGRSREQRRAVQRKKETEEGAERARRQWGAAARRGLSGGRGSGVASHDGTAGRGLVPAAPAAHVPGEEGGGLRVADIQAGCAAAKLTPAPRSVASRAFIARPQSPPPLSHFSGRPLPVVSSLLRCGGGGGGGRRRKPQ
jgi:hypothetical protein